MMEIGGLTDHDHEVLGVEYCSGYTDSFGKWNTGFPCPTLGNGERVYCCGTISQKYCCTRRDEERAPTIDQTMLLGIVLGAMVVVVLVTIVSCFLCRRCLTQRKRHHAPTNGGPLYRMHCSSTASGVANMYSFSGQNSSATTPIEGLEPHLMVDLGNNPNAAPNGQLPITHVHQHHLQRHTVANGGGTLPRVPSFGNGTTNTLSHNYRVGNNRFGHCPLNHTEPPPPYQQNSDQGSARSRDLILSPSSQMGPPGLQSYHSNMVSSPSTTSFTPICRRDRAGESPIQTPTVAQQPIQQPQRSAAPSQSRTQRTHWSTKF